jgi:putative N6-adenine-specific DNA methylase
MMRANLWLRAASRILVRVARFRATQFFELEKRAKKIEWGRFLPSDGAAEFRVTARKSKLYHSDAIAERLFSAVGSRLSANSVRTENRGPRAENQLFVVRVFRDTVEISADTSGEHLHLRGYRQAVAKAPLRETLAAALVLGADWTGDTPLLDPFCGSGTIPIEAALIARRMAPGLRREFSFQRWPAFDKPTWKTLLSEARANECAASYPILASDRDAGAIDAARANAERAGVASNVTFAVAAISNASAPESSRGGLVATNPPYGKRIGAGRDVRDLYAQLGNVMTQRFPGWRLALYAPDVRLARQTRLPLEELYRTTNGGIPVVALCSGRDLSH